MVTGVPFSILPYATAQRFIEGKLSWMSLCEGVRVGTGEVEAGEAFDAEAEDEATADDADGDARSSISQTDFQLLSHAR